jgi:hypothetical protein
MNTSKSESKWEVHLLHAGSRGFLLALFLKGIHVTSHTDWAMVAFRVKQVKPDVSRKLEEFQEISFDIQ